MDTALIVFLIVVLFIFVATGYFIWKVLEMVMTGLHNLAEFIARQFKR